MADAHFIAESPHPSTIDPDKLDARFERARKEADEGLLAGLRVCRRSIEAT
jgi:hypothetical protein